MRKPRAKRRIAIAIPACNEAGYIGACLDQFSRLVPDPRISAIDIVVLANNCSDSTAEKARAAGTTPGERIHVETVDIPPERAHAGWARRLALEAAAGYLRAPDDVLMCTDADTLVADDWVSRTLDHFDAGWDAVAGYARLNPRELRALARPHRARLAAIHRYENALTFLKARQKREEPWPRHYYEGGASIALRLAIFERIDGAPTPRVGEDKALFDAVRRLGGRVRHPTDVRVLTSSRLDGRAAGGASDTLSLWGRQGEDEGVYELSSLATALGFSDAGGGRLTFRDLPAETRKARSLVRSARHSDQLAMAS